jgi:hypothetical protein
MGKALGIKRIVRQELELLALHSAAASAAHPPHLELQIDARVATGKIAYLSHPAVVPAVVRAPTAAAERFFERRTRVMTRAFGSPKTPRTVGSGRKPGNAYASQSRRRRRFAEFAIQT